MRIEILYVVLLAALSVKGGTPDGTEWQNPQLLSHGKFSTTATFWPFSNEKGAMLVMPQESDLVMNLDGKWAFLHVNTPDKRPDGFFLPTNDNLFQDSIYVPSNWNVVGIGEYGQLRYGRPIYVNQKVIFQHKVAIDDWRGGVMRTPPESWTTYTDRNEVGIYRRSFNVPENWDGKRICLKFDGIDSFFYLWVNGHYIGFSKNSRTPAAFDVTPYLHDGENNVTVEVYRNSDGSFLEAQDMFRLPGIFRSVWVYATPETRINDLQVRTDLIDNYKSGKLDITADIASIKGASGLRMLYRLYPLALYSDSVCGNYVVEKEEEIKNLRKDTETSVHTSIELPGANQWSAEVPNRYLLTASLIDNKGGTLMSTSVFTGFRKVEIRNLEGSENEYGEAGLYFLINGKMVKLRGVNRHETDPNCGHAISRDRMTNDIMAMKRANINHVRNSHYPDDPYWYYLCDRYGIYLMDEANLESHEYYYGAASLSHVPEFKDAHVARVMDMARTNANHPSVIMWSLGNEAGPGVNFKAAYDALKEFDPSRPINYERNNDYADIGSCQYPSVEWVGEAASGKLDIKYPFHINEYAHSMGNAVGNLSDYWRHIESSGHIMGGAIWDWADQSIYFTDSISGTRFEAYGGDFGDFPNDGQFVMNGIMFADLSPKPQYWEVKKVYQPVEIKATDQHVGKLSVFNRLYFSSLNDFECIAMLMADGIVIDSAMMPEIEALAPRSGIQIDNPFADYEFNPDTEYFILLSFRHKSDMPWCEKGYEAFAEQIPLGINPPVMPFASTSVTSNFGKLHVDKKKLSVKNQDFYLHLDADNGSIATLVYDGDTIISGDHGPRPDTFRAFVNNDTWLYKSLFTNGLHNMRHQAYDWQITSNKEKQAIFSCTIKSAAPNKAIIHGGTSSGHPRVEELTDSACNFSLLTHLKYIVSPSGVITIEANIIPSDSTVDLARIGFAMELPAKYQNLTYYGRGPHENYADRKTGSFIGRYESSVAQQFTPYPKPQNMGNHEDSRWIMLTDSLHRGIHISASQPFAFTALPYSEMQLLNAPHPYELPATDLTYLHIDKAMTGLGGYSCGQGPPFPADRVKATPVQFSFTISPVNRR